MSPLEWNLAQMSYISEIQELVEDWVCKVCVYGNQSIDVAESMPLSKLRRYARKMEELHGRHRGITF